MTSIEYTRRELLEVLSEKGYSLNANSFKRYREAAGIPVKPFYTVADMKAIAFIGWYLKRDRNLERASEALTRELALGA